MCRRKEGKEWRQRLIKGMRSGKQRNGLVADAIGCTLTHTHCWGRLGPPVSLWTGNYGHPRNIARAAAYCENRIKGAISSSILLFGSSWSISKWPLPQADAHQQQSRSAGQEDISLLDASLNSTDTASTWKSNKNIQ